MKTFHYSSWYNSPEACPALYIDFIKPDGGDPFVTDLQACLDTGSATTAIPEDIIAKANLISFGPVEVKWPFHPTQKVQGYMVYLKADNCKPRFIEVIPDPFHKDYAIIGRNLMKHWKLLLNGPESIFEINE